MYVCYICNVFKLHPQDIEADSATPSSDPPAIELHTFQSIRSTLEADFSHDPIMVANAIFSKGIITQQDLHDTRLVPSNENKARRLASLIQDTLREHPFKFESFTSALRSISSHVKLADRISHLYRFNLVSLKMRKSCNASLDMNYFSAELNNSQLISDEVRLKATTVTTLIEICSIFLAELHSKDLEEPYITLLDSYPNTESVCSDLRKVVASRSSTAAAAKTDSNAEPKPAEAARSKVTRRQASSQSSGEKLLSRVSTGEERRYQSPDGDSGEYLSCHDQESLSRTIDGDSVSYTAINSDEIILGTRSSSGATATATTTTVFKKSANASISVIVPKDKGKKTEYKVRC